MNAIVEEVRVAPGRHCFHRSGVDRRANEERRQVYDLAYFERGGVERRRGEERRASGENRAGWVRVTEWSSICICETVASSAFAMSR